MNLKALITTLVLGTSSAAMADSSVSVRGSVKVSIGGSPAHHHTNTVVDDCAPTPAPRPAYNPTTRPPVVVARPAPQTPVYRGPYYNITNTTIVANKSVYNGSITKAPLFRVASHQNGYWRPQQAATWFDLTEATRIDSGRQFFKIGAEQGRFQGLKLQALGTGRSEIKQVVIEYVDNLGHKKTQKVVLNQWISGTHNPSITIDLDGGYRSIGRIIVYGSTDRGSAYKLLAM